MTACLSYKDKGEEISMGVYDFTRNIQQQVAMMQRLMPDTRTIQMLQEQALLAQRFLPATLLMQRVSEQANMTHRLLSEFSALQKVIEQTNLTRRLLPEVSVLQKVIEQSSLTSNLLSNMNIPSKAIENTSTLMWAYVSLSEMPWANIGSLLKLEEASRITLGNSFLAFSNSYFAFSEFLEKTALGPSLTSTASLFELPEIELFNGADLLEAITVDNAVGEETEEDVANKQSLRNEISAQTEESLEMLLAGLDKDLTRLWQGANQAIISENVDRSRHVLISLRELFTHVLHQLAPDEEIHKWTTAPEFFDRGRPTRKARLFFICREINSHPFCSFVEKDVASILAFWDILNRAHELSLSLTQQQLVALKIWMEGALRLLLVTSKLT